MKPYGTDWLKPAIAQDLIRRAARSVWDGINPRDPYFAASMSYHVPTGTVFQFTREEGYHTSGWWKNPDYERCWHLSLSFRDPITNESRPRDKPLSKEWINLIFRDSAKLLWCEPPYTPQGKQIDVWHYRLFVSPGWGPPILPRGEVYSKQFTERGWKSFSDVQADLEVGANP